MALKILIVDDSITVRAVLKKALTLTRLEVGEVVQAANGVEALRVLTERPVDFVFTDIVMPEMNGEELIVELNAKGRLPDLPVVVISSAGDVALIERLRNLGARGFVHKPFTPEQIEDVVKANLGVGAR